MKLSKKQLEDFIVGSMRDNGENGWGSEQEHAALEALRNGSLEIEGYERAQWVEFDPNDPETFPPKNEYLDVFECSKKHRWRAADMLTEFWWQRNIESWSINVNSRGYTIYWRPLPPAPGKEEAK